jgi:WD40 repeat protein
VHLIPRAVFALVTSAGTLIAYNRYVPVRALAKLTAHSGDAITLDWHPQRPYVVATGGARDRCVKVWNLESYLNIDSAGNVNASTMSTSHIMNLNSNTVTSTGTEDTNETDRSA